MNEAVLNSALQSKLRIPPRPEVVCVIQEEMRREAPDLTRIGRAIGADVGLAGALLRAVNAPVFGLTRKVSSITQAISLLGLRNAATLATALVLRGTLSQEPASMERFWDTAEKAAMLGAHLAGRLKGIPLDEAYSIGLFHDCGIPILMKYFPNYKATLARANHAGDRPFTQVEEEEIGTNHATVGYFLARSWNLSDTLCQAILWHHDIEVFADPNVPDAVRNHIGIIQLAEHIQHLAMRSAVDLEWTKFETVVRAHFALTEEDFITLVDEAEEAMFGA